MEPNQPKLWCLPGTTMAAAFWTLNSALQCVSFGSTHSLTLPPSAQFASFTATRNMDLDSTWHTSWHDLSFKLGHKWIGLRMCRREICRRTLLVVFVDLKSVAKAETLAPQPKTTKTNTLDSSILKTALQAERWQRHLGKRSSRHSSPTTWLQGKEAHPNKANHSTTSTLPTPSPTLWSLSDDSTTTIPPATPLLALLGVVLLRVVAGPCWVPPPGSLAVSWLGGAQPFE